MVIKARQSRVIDLILSIYCSIILCIPFSFMYRNDNRILSNSYNEHDLKELKLLEKRIRFLMVNQSMEFNILEKLPIKFFNKNIKHIMNVLGQGVEDGTNDVDCNEDEKCMKEVTMARLIYKMSFGGGNRKQLFGSFLKSFTPILLDQFDSNEVMSVVCILFQCQTDLCSKFDTAEKHLHDYFANLSIALGFSEKISLFEVPSLVSFFRETMSVKKSDVFMNFRCNKHIKVTRGDLFECNQQLIGHEVKGKAYF